MYTRRGAVERVMTSWAASFGVECEAHRGSSRPEHISSGSLPLPPVGRAAATRTWMRACFTQGLVNPEQTRVLRSLREWDDGRFGDLFGGSENRSLNRVVSRIRCGISGLQTQYGWIIGSNMGLRSLDPMCSPLKLGPHPTVQFRG